MSPKRKTVSGYYEKVNLLIMSISFLRNLRAMGVIPSDSAMVFWMQKLHPQFPGTFF